MIILFKRHRGQVRHDRHHSAAAAGIRLKLLVTVWGLIVGIPAYVAYNYFTTVINGYVLSVEESASELMETVTCRCRSPKSRKRSVRTARTVATRYAGRAPQS